MNHRRVTRRSGIAVAAAAAAGIAAAAILLPHANANTDSAGEPRTFTSQSATRLAASLDPEVREKTAGWYLDGATGRMVVNVVSKDAARRVGAEGAVPRIVRNSAASLKAAARTLSSDASVPGTAWSVDPRTNKVVVTADRTVTGGRLEALTKVTDRMGGLVRVKRSPGEFRRYDGGAAAHGPAAGDSRPGAARPGGSGATAPGAGDGAGGSGAGGSGSGGSGAGGPVGGSAIFGAGARCSLGFNVTVQGAPAFLTAGHCGNASRSWTADQAGGVRLGSVVTSQFPGADFALVKYDDPGARPASAVGLEGGAVQQITGAAEASVGLRVQRTGSTTGLKDGTVTGLGATVNYGNGDIVNGLVQTDVCAEPGDSGGALFAGESAVGLTSGGSGDCTQGGETFFQPVTAALQATGAVIGAGGEGAVARR
ncbi:S1 family peptidase [Streptomyces sp. NPDC046215]|uniref:S1 family peptidase n=1 Tax=Streptomyces stramineus TaxID=173861 RepID=A0ABP3JH02_9ACTN